MIDIERLNFWSWREHCLHCGTVEDQNRENAKHGPERHQQTFHTSHDKAKCVMLSAGNKSASRQDQHAYGPADQNETRGENDEEPADESRRLVAAVAHLLWSEDKEKADDQMNDREAGKQKRHSTNHVMEYREQLQMFGVCVRLLNRR